MRRDLYPLRQVLKGGCPHPSECDLYYVERDTLFSHHKAAEDFLQVERQASCELASAAISSMLAKSDPGFSAGDDVALRVVALQELPQRPSAAVGAP